MAAIRKPKPEDTPQLEALFQLTRQKTFKSHPQDEFQIGDYAKSVQEDEIWVAEENGDVIGFVSTYPADNFVHNLFVHPDYQGCSIGSRLLQIAETSLSRPMALKVAMDNLDVCGFYESRGWLQVSVHENVPDPYILYRKD